MHQNHSAPDNDHPDRRPVPAVGAVTDPVLGSADRAQLRRLEKTGGWSRRERLRVVWYRLRLTVQEMNYATRRMAELQMRLP